MVMSETSDSKSPTNELTGEQEEEEGRDMYDGNDFVNEGNFDIRSSSKAISEPGFTFKGKRLSQCRLRDDQEITKRLTESSLQTVEMPGENVIAIQQNARMMVLKALGSKYKGWCKFA